MREIHTQNPEKVNVWAGVIGENVIGPFFIDGNLNGETYLALLQNNVVPTMVNLCSTEGNLQLPALSPHNLSKSLERRRDSVESARSPVLTPLDFFLSGYVKSMVYKTKPDDLADLRRRIILAIRSITPQVLINARRHFYLRLGCCQDAGGMHFEHLLH
ncbi:hypothetical protein NQ318_009026 [Aromia moschata]|uniref:Uncharacterized protein n=1 Tax=Aromia moschata TaxID=1265417 RepID=A0AAV8YVY6_9CUCU|nr:hypothetical protein NQ318_009026 [Aromia moschata]